MSISLITLHRQAETLVFSATAARLLENCDPEASARHLANFRVLHRTIGEMFEHSDKTAALTLSKESNHE